MIHSRVTGRLLASLGYQISQTYTLSSVRVSSFHGSAEAKMSKSVLS